MGVRDWGATPILTNAMIYVEPVDGAQKTTLGMELADTLHNILTEEQNIQLNDKCVIDSQDYFVRNVSMQTMGAVQLTRLILSNKAA